MEIQKTNGVYMLHGCYAAIRKYFFQFYYWLLIFVPFNVLYLCKAWVFWASILTIRKAKLNQQ